MSNASSQSRSSIESGTQSTTASVEHKHIPRIPHPPRLQHSPSLPNICFPQHSGPISREKEKQVQETMHRPSAPPSPKSRPPAAVTDREVQIRHVKYASIDPTYRKPSGSKTHNRRRTERDEPHSLLTPPLTPSSSIRTTASLDGAISTTTQSNREFIENATEEILDTDTESTRILLLENVSPSVTVEFLESTLLDALANAVTDNNGPTPSTSSYAPNDILKGINPRLHHDEGIVPLVFYDVRFAKITRDLIVTKRVASRLTERTGGGECQVAELEELSARLIPLEELRKILGHSRFLDGIEGSFSFRAHKIQRGGETDNDYPISDREMGEDHTCEGSVPDCSPKDAPLTRQGINLVVLHNFLRSFGGIRNFKIVQQEVDQQGLVTMVYHVEYHDLRDAQKAYQELQERTVFGMRINAIKGNAEPERPATYSNGSQSFLHPSSGNPSSPTFFYTTTPFDNQNLPLAQHDQGPAHIRGEVRRSSNLEMVPRTMAHEQWHWEPDALTYRTDGVCHYCPSGCTHHNMSYNPPLSPYTFSASPPTPPTYYPGHIATQHIPGMVNVVPNPAVPMLGYEYTLDTRMQLSPYNGAWNYDPRTAAAGPGMSTPSPIPFFLREDAAPVHGGMFYTGPPMHSPIQEPQVQSQPPPPPQQEVPDPASALVFYRSRRFSAPVSSSPSSDGSAGALVPADASPRPAGHLSGSANSDRNQLNIMRIMSGEDTRTTVMIKNIPNKMSDTDLTAYIAKVVPRKIDFLYLRMDFKNGCNVGYAFVNFIDVEDLLLFAKERLGAKWNMFSSEKVLQMSYANYQGKEALVEKFKNSAIMDERESWRPRIFYSSGENEGLPEPFPAPTHIRRKERSSYNRNTLFPPGVNSHTIAAQSHGLLQNTPRRYLDDMRYLHNHGRLGITDQYQNQTHGRRAEESGGEGARDDRVPFSRNLNQCATR